MRYSVIIPIYNAENTLPRCLDSLASQLRDDMEVLLIDDGSADESFQICQTYAQQHPQFFPIHQENDGVSSARNRGLDLARGDYILFVDSDDYVSTDYFSVLDRALADHPDMLLFGYQNFGAYDSAWDLGEYTVFDSVEIAKKADYGMREYLFSSLWSKAFCRSIIENNHLRFSRDLSIGEDQTFIFSYTLHVKSLKAIQNKLYYVSTGDQESLSRKRRDYLTVQMLEMYRSMHTALKFSEVDEKSRYIYTGALAWIFYRSAYSCMKELLKYPYSAKQRRKRISEICALYRKEVVFPRDTKCGMIALPIVLNAVLVLDAIITRR